MNERIKEIRLALGLTQKEFGYKLGIKQTSIASIEIGRTNLSEQAIAAICYYYNVNENWLRTGQGSMFNSPADSFNLSSLIEEFNLDDTEILIINNYLSLTDKQRKEFIDIIKLMFNLN